MKTVPNKLPDYTSLLPIGTKVRWAKGGNWNTEIHEIAGYYDCPVLEFCNECDGVQYVMKEGPFYRCHFRRPSSRFGLAFWEEVG